MVTAVVHNPFETDLPGELAGDRWEAVQDAECLVCEQICTPTATGVCWQCEARYRASGAGCGLAAVLVAGLGNPAVVLGHLTGCSDCRDFFLDLGRTAEVAHMESTHAASLVATA